MNWIKVEDSLPEEGQKVIYWFKHTGRARGKFTMTEHGACFYGKGGWLTDDVTHWMPDDGREILPKPPKE
jgi:hypothetical protein